MSVPAQVASGFTTHNFVIVDCLVSPTLDRLTRAGETIQLEPKVMQVLVCLASRGQEVVSKQELLDEVWPDTFVSDHVLSHVVWQLRRALGSPELIETVPRRGYRLTVGADLQAEPTLPKPTATLTSTAKRRWLLVPVLATAVLSIGAATVWVSSEWATVARPPVRRLLMVPFESTGAGSDQRAFVAGIDQSLREKFFEIRALQVVSSRTTAAILYTGGARKPLRQLARETQSDAILQSTAAVIDGRVRIGVELWDARTDRTTYSETFERELKELLPLYSEIVRKVAAEANVAITDAEAMRLGGPVLNTEGVREYLLGLATNNREAAEHYRRAIASNPQFAPAYVGAAMRLRNIAEFGSTVADARVLAEQARVMARKGVELDPKSASAQVVLALVEANLFWDWKEAGRKFEEAEKLRPLDQALLHHHVAFLVAIRRCDEALRLVEREKVADPTGSWPPYYAHWSHYQCGQLEAAINDAQAALARDPTARWVHFHTAYAYALTGHYPEAIAECEKASQAGKCEEPYLVAVAGRTREAREILTKWERDRAPGPYFQALGYVGLGERERALERLSEAYALRDPALRFIWDPAFTPLRDDRRFQELSCKIDLPPGGCEHAGQ